MNWEVLLIFRFITGVLLGCISVVTPMFIAEISPVKQRGQLVLLNQFFVLTAIFMAFVVFKRIQAEKSGKRSGHCEKIG